MRIGKPEVKKFLKFGDGLKIGETFRPHERDYGDNDIFMKIPDVYENPWTHVDVLYNAVNLKNGLLYCFGENIDVEYVDAYIEEVNK